MKCEKCKAEIPIDSKFCTSCGSKVENVKKVYCTHCGEQIDSNLSVCPYCGKNVKTGLVNELDQENHLLELCAFLFPIAGILMWAATKDKTPIRASGILKWTMVGIIFWTIKKIIF